MYARSTTFHGMPGHVDAGIAFARTEVAPLLARTEGCLGLSVLVDRETGQCVATSSWQDDEVMRAANERLRPIRERGRDVLRRLHPGGRLGGRRHAPHPARRVLPRQLAPG